MTVTTPPEAGNPEKYSWRTALIALIDRSLECWSRFWRLLMLITALALLAVVAIGLAQYLGVHGVLGLIASWTAHS